ncbi:MAG: histidine phosphatase family protein [Candidatus Abyssobacteria bacterium SURF_17]|uniref:Histidine phosphatase family protein n=1 Tax=Candidatus Abyssobacteria bacterium SURF_17 TaxID=2093361 RepID=A0A419ET94_9BACT|nr:MAG: histidine phosphatase family protein [Candidatus Abyssubacteria bacterium SURF_17]
MFLYLIRHGETDWNVERRCQGFSDIELNATGRWQAGAIARHLSSLKVEALYSSTLKRAHETASTIARYHDAPVQATDALRELNQGAFEGLKLTELVARHSDFLERWFRDPADLRLPSGESLREMQSRAWAALDKIIGQHPDGNVIVVSHNLCNMGLLCRIMKLELNDFRRIQQDVAAISLIEFGRWPHPVVIRLNDTSHLR